MEIDRDWQLDFHTCRDSASPQPRRANCTFATYRPSLHLSSRDPQEIQYCSDDRFDCANDEPSHP